MRSSSDEDSIIVDQQASQQHLRESNPTLHSNSAALYQVEVECSGGNKFQHYCESGRETPSSSIITQHQQPALHQSTVTIKSSQPHYYTDDSEMPAWKIYAKEL